MSFFLNSCCSGSILFVTIQIPIYIDIKWFMNNHLFHLPAHSLCEHFKLISLWKLNFLTCWLSIKMRYLNCYLYFCFPLRGFKQMQSTVSAAATEGIVVYIFFKLFSKIIFANLHVSPLVFLTSDPSFHRYPIWLKTKTEFWSF